MRKEEKYVDEYSVTHSVITEERKNWMILSFWTTLDVQQSHVQNGEQQS
jgi:hypothetical protein